jgi:peptide/nickel transport system substrate-binding protein
VRPRAHMAVALVAALTLALGLQACGGSSSDDSGGGASASGAAAATGGGGSSSATPAAAPAAGADQSITVAVNGDAGTLDPHTSTDANANAIIWEIYDGLTLVDGSKVEPDLAAEMPKSVGKRTWEVKLRKGVVFSDGKPFNAAAVVYSLNRLATVATTVPEAATLAKTTKVDDYTVKIATKAPDPLLPNKLAAMKILPVGQAKDVNHPIGTGVYKLESYSPGQQAVLVYNDKYRGTKPQVTKVTLKFIPDPATRLRALQAGEVDIISALDPDQIPQVPKEITSPNPVFTMWLRINTNIPPLDDVRVRQAINYAINKDAIVDNLFPKGLASVNQCQIGPPNTGNADPNLKPYPFDLDKAKALIQQAGAAGKQLTLTWPTGAYPLDREVGQEIAQELNATGLKIKLRLLENAENQKNITDTDKNGSDFAAAASADSLGNIERLTASFYPSAGPVSSYDDPKMDALFTAASSKPLGTPERQTAFNTMLDYGCKQAVMAYLYDYKDVYGVSKRIDYTPIAPSLRPYWSRVKIVAPGH